MTRSQHPPCAGSAIYGPHSAKIPSGYTVIDPAGQVLYFCDTDCLARVIEQRRNEPVRLRKAAR